MKALRNMPIKRKLAIMTLLTSGAALLLTCFAFVTYELVVFHANMVSTLSSTALMAGYNSSAALSFNDPVSAAETLKSMTAHPHIVGAAVYDKNGIVFATFHRAASNGHRFTEAFNPPAIEPDGHRFTGHNLQVFRRIDLAGEKIGTICIQSDLDEIYARLWRYVLIVLIVMVAASFVAFLISRRMQTVISGPVAHLLGVVGAVAREKDYSVRAVKQDEDELGQLIDGFNAMLNQIQMQDGSLQEARDNLERRVEERTRELESIHKQLMEVSRRSGMAEIATNVLHNVGNTLNSVNVSLSLVVDSVSNSKASSVGKVAALLRENEGAIGTFIASDPRGKQLPAYLEQLSDRLLADRDATLRELDSLQKYVRHIMEIVAMQQNYANVSGVKEVVDIKSLVEDSLRMNASALNRHGVEIIRELDEVPPMNVDKHRILQILVNLVRNAKYACEESGRADKRLTVRMAGGDGKIRISLVDNGVGIPPENLMRIFSHGFTTRKDGHGFGLHGSALAAKEMGGSLTVHSDGPGQGAAFTLELPYETNESAHE